MSDADGSSKGLPRRAATRTAKLAALPMGYAGRKALGLGKRIGGKPAEAVLADVHQRTADQLFRTLGELKGGAMKFGQALSVMEAALPEELVAPYRAQLTKLQDSAPPMSLAAVHVVLARELGSDWHERLVELEEEPAASASLGQVHRGRWHDGREVAVKVQYPGADKAFISDLRQVARLGRTFGTLAPGIDIKPLIDELLARADEELDYRIEAEAQQGFAEAFRDDPDYTVPEVVAYSQRVLVTTWMESTGSLAGLIAEGDRAARDHYGELYARFLFDGPARSGMLHADPHPGNFRILPTADGSLGGLGIVDFGAVARLAEGGLPAAMGRLARLATDEDYEELLALLRAEGFVKPSIRIEPQGLRDYLGPFLEPARHERFTFDRAWLRTQFDRVTDPHEPGYTMQLKLNLPPAYLLIHRTLMGVVGVLGQLEATLEFRAMLEEHLPGFADQD